MSNIKSAKALIITGFGINCEEEMEAAYRLSGAQAKTVHLNDIFSGKYDIHNFDVLNFPGGFSFGDDLGSGKVLANKIKFKKMANGNTFLTELEIFIAEGKFILGVCNGFQFLVKIGLLPNTNDSFSQEVTLTTNDSAKFEDRWCYCTVNSQSNSPFLSGIDKIYLPVRHKEGKLIIKNSEIRQNIRQNSLDCMAYSDKKGRETGEYPLNPNGSELNCAALSDKSGQILGMMPHPEAFLSLYNHPNWGKIKQDNPNISDEGEGLKIFKNIVDLIVVKKARTIEKD